MIGWILLKSVGGLTAWFALESSTSAHTMDSTGAGWVYGLLEGQGETCVSLYAHHGPPWRGAGKDGRSILGRRLKGKGRHRTTTRAFASCPLESWTFPVHRCASSLHRPIDPGILIELAYCVAKLLPALSSARRSSNAIYKSLHDHRWSPARLFAFHLFCVAICSSVLNSLTLWRSWGTSRNFYGFRVPLCNK